MIKKLCLIGLMFVLAGMMAPAGAYTFVEEPSIEVTEFPWDYCNGYLYETTITFNIKADPLLGYYDEGRVDIIWNENESDQIAQFGVAPGTSQTFTYRKCSDREPQAVSIIDLEEITGLPVPGGSYVKVLQGNDVWYGAEIPEGVPVIRELGDVANLVNVQAFTAALAEAGIDADEVLDLLSGGAMIETNYGGGTSEWGYWTPEAYTQLGWEWVDAATGSTYYTVPEEGLLTLEAFEALMKASGAAPSMETLKAALAEAGDDVEKVLEILDIDNMLETDLGGGTTEWGYWTPEDGYILLGWEWVDAATGSALYTVPDDGVATLLTFRALMKSAGVH
jgi:hypothetical protein